MVGSPENPEPWTDEIPLDKKFHDVDHGTANAYNYGCRCRKCRDAHARRLSEWRARNKDRKEHINAANRAKTRLTQNHPEEYEALLAEELGATK